jgi:hypothetical protein
VNQFDKLSLPSQQKKGDDILPKTNVVIVVHIERVMYVYLSLYLHTILMYQEVLYQNLGITRMCSDIPFRMAYSKINYFTPHLFGLSKKQRVPSITQL